MKTLLIVLLLLINLVAGEHTILVSGFSKHTNSQDSSGREFNEVHTGIGYIYSTYEENGDENLYYSLTALVFDDSYNNLMYSGTIGVNYMLYDNHDLRLNVGVESGIGYKNVYYTNSNDSEYSIIPVVLPRVSVEYSNISMNITYVPYIEYQDYIVEEVVYMNFGYRF